MAIVATHLGVVDEEQINNMSYVFFDDILSELGLKLTYDAIVNYAGNSFCEKSWDMIVEHNPFNVETDTPGKTSNKTLKSLEGFFNSSAIKIGKPKQKRGKG